MRSQEIVTKAVIGKGKKKTKKIFDIDLNGIDNVLGCWVINHKFSGNVVNNNIVVNGFYDINVWYSYDNNTKTNVLLEHILYEDTMNVRLKNNGILSSDNGVVVRCVNQPSVIDVIKSEKNISLTIEKEMTVEVIGDTLVSVNVSDEETYYEDINDYDEINEDYLN